MTSKTSTKSITLASSNQRKSTPEVVGSHPTKTGGASSVTQLVGQSIQPPRMIGNRAFGHFLQCKRKSGELNSITAKSKHALFVSTPDKRPTEIQTDAGKSVSGTGMPNLLRAALEALSGIDLSNIRVHRNSSKPAEVNALAYTQGQDIHLGPGQEKYLPHEGWHVVQQRQGRVRSGGIHPSGVAINDESHLETEADRMALRISNQPIAVRSHGTLSKGTLVGQPNHPIQRQVRVGGGATRVNEAQYLPTGRKKSVGSKHSVAALISDSVKRVFSGVRELEDFANGKPDYIGDVAPSGAPKSWYRLPKNKMTILGEKHHNPQGNVEDVIIGLGTSRFMYEPFNELPADPGHPAPFTSTQARLAQVNKGIAVAGRVSPMISPNLENIVIKAITGAAITRNEFIPSNPATLTAAGIAKWGKRASVSNYSYGERTALYLSFGIHLASDIAKNNFGPPNFVESTFVTSARNLQAFYLNNQAVLDQFKNTKDSDDLIGIYELTQPGNFANLSVIKDFTLALHEYGSLYIEELGMKTGNKALEAEGKALAAKPGATISDLSPAREEIMWNKIKKAKNYLIVGMGEQHRINLQTRLNAAGIPNEEVQASLAKQTADVAAKWKP